MSFTYDPTKLTTDTLSRARFEIGDVTQDSGVLPGGSNLQDEEIQHYLNTAADFETAVAQLFGRLAARWITQPDYKMGPLSESSSQVAKGFRELSEYWRQQAPSFNGANSFPLVVDDGYSNDHPGGTLWGPDSDYQQHI